MDMQKKQYLHPLSVGLTLLGILYFTIKCALAQFCAQSFCLAIVTDFQRVVN